jgi:hypothetical protein
MFVNSPASFTTIPNGTGLDRLVDMLNQFLRVITRSLTPVVGTFRVNDTTPAVSGASVWTTANTSPTSVTTFTKGAPGQFLVVVSGDTNTTLVNGGTLVLTSGANITLTSGQVTRFITLDGTTWRQA